MSETTIRSYKGWSTGDKLIAVFIYENTQYTIRADDHEKLNELISKVFENNVPEKIEMVIYTKDEMKEKQWLESYEKLSKTEKWMIQTAIPELNDIPIAKRKIVSKIASIAGRRVINAGFKKTCNRCGGTGHYSFSPMYGTVCFKCNGAKYELPKLTKEIKTEIEKYFTQNK